MWDQFRGTPVYRDMFGRGSITGTAMQKTVFFFQYDFKNSNSLEMKVIT
jgi:hypothetical protein